jgi:hypothetical protein
MALNLLLEGKNNQVKNKELPHKRPTSSVVRTPVGKKEERIVLKPPKVHVKLVDVS